MNTFSKRKVRDEIGKLMDSVEKNKHIFPFDYYAGMMAGLKMARTADILTPLKIKKALRRNKK